MTKLWEMLVPAQDGNAPIPLSKHKKLDQEIRKVSEGMTLFGSVTGEWKDKRERMIPVRFMATYPKAVDIAHFAKTHYSQEEIMLYEISNNIYFI